VKPEYWRSNGNTRVVELDSGTYRSPDFLWREFKISHHGICANPEVFGEIVARWVSDAIKKAREDGVELEYLGYQAQMRDAILDGCLVFNLPGQYEKVAKPGEDYPLPMYGPLLNTMEAN
jgi:hypothetical protein